MSDSTTTILFVFGLVGLGWLIARLSLLKETTGEGLADFAVNVAVPVLLFRTMSTADFSETAPSRFLMVYFGSVAVAWIAGHMVIRHIFGRDRQASVVGGVTSAFSNLVLIGIPLTLSLLGQGGFEILSLLLAVHLPIMLSVSILLFEWANRDEEAFDVVKVGSEFLRRLFSNPLIIGILSGLIFRMTGLGLPAPVPDMIDALANVAGPVALFALGMSLNDFGISGNLRAAAVLTAIKLLLMPVTALILSMLVGLPDMIAEVAIVAASLPAGVNAYLIAMRFGTGQALAASAMTMGTGLALFSSVFWFSVAKLIWS